MKRILTFHDPEKQSAGRLGAAYYVESGFNPVAVHIHAGDAPFLAEARFDIYANGISIFNDRGYLTRNSSSVITENVTGVTYVSLGINQDSEEYLGDFVPTGVDAESWITCELLDNNGGGRNFTVQLEIEEHE